MPVEKLTRQTIRQFLQDPNAFATSLIVCLTDVYGTEFMTWTPMTIRMETEEDFGFQWPTANFDRVMAGIVLLTTNRFYKSLPDFIDLCNVLSGAPLNPAVFDPADAAECAWGITEALLLAPPDEDDSDPFTDEIRGYIGETVAAEGIITPPDILRIGLRDDARIKVHYNFSDDPELFNAIFDAEAGKTEDINSLVKERLALLLEQLGALNLKNGDTQEIVAKMLRGLSAPTKGDVLD